jgi:hypothetical protein
VIDIPRAFEWTKELCMLMEKIKDGRFQAALKKTDGAKDDAVNFGEFTPHLLVFCNNLPPIELLGNVSATRWDFWLIDAIYSDLFRYTGYEKAIAKLEMQRYKESIRMAKGEMVRKFDPEEKMLRKAFVPHKGAAARSVAHDLLKVMREKYNYKGNAITLGLLIKKVYGHKTFVARDHTRIGKVTGSAWSGLANRATGAEA